MTTNSNKYSKNNTQVLDPDHLDTFLSLNPAGQVTFVLCSTL